jgi:hypothetical protein
MLNRVETDLDEQLDAMLLAIEADDDDVVEGETVDDSEDSADDDEFEEDDAEDDVEDEDDELADSGDASKE